ncbi:MAG: hypothetical protein C3F13_00920 [Anaerolineales bacterium]|nr:hypothetical protein [Anaerolineae bacterium]PWB56665.1 MAG: hypothetical protein C3F13_00920 [Anaerolineales bacterium]
MDAQDNIIAEQNQLTEVDTAWTGKILAIGGVLGALTGLAAAYLLVQRSKKMGERPTLELGEGIKLGVLLFGLLRNIALLGDRE